MKPVDEVQPPQAQTGGSNPLHGAPGADGRCAPPGRPAHGRPARGRRGGLHHAWCALEEAYVIGQKPVAVDTVQEVLAPDLDGLEPRLTRLRYPVKALCEALNARPAEIRAFLQGRLASGRTQELRQELLTLAINAVGSGAMNAGRRAGPESLIVGQARCSTASRACNEREPNAYFWGCC